jgi:hypothetical protein
MLGQHPRIFAAGELSNIWSSFEKGGHCQCGRTVDSCSFWGPLTQTVVRAFGLGSPGDIERLRLSAARTRHFMRMKSQGSMSDEQKTYVAILRTLHQEILTRSGAATLVDTSKKAVDLLLVSRASSTAAVHIVRSPYGVAASESDSAKHLNVPPVDRPPFKKPARSALEWVAANQLARLASRRIGGPTLGMTYESLVNHPARELDRIAIMLDAEPYRWEIRGREFNMPALHLVNGNPCRARSGWQELHLPESRGTLSAVDIWSVRSVVAFGNFGHYQSPPARRVELTAHSLPAPSHQLGGHTP